MTSILRRLPFFESDYQYSMDYGPVTIPAHQILVWITICHKGSAPYDKNAPLVPALLDTGFNGTFCIREEQLRDWANVDPARFKLLVTKDHQRGIMQRRLANVWVHRNLPGSVQAIRERPHRFELNGGISVFVSLADGRLDARPALPLLGMRSLIGNNMCLTVNCQRKYVTLKRPFWS